MCSFWVIVPYEVLLLGGTLCGGHVNGYMMEFISIIIAPNSQQT